MILKVFLISTEVTKHCIVPFLRQKLVPQFVSLPRFYAGVRIVTLISDGKLADTEGERLCLLYHRVQKNSLVQLQIVPENADIPFLSVCVCTKPFKYLYKQVFYS